MAYQLTEWVQNHTPKAKGADKCVLYALAHRIPFGQTHWTCMAYELSNWTGIPERTLRDCCKRLVDAGYLIKEGKGGRKKDKSGIPSKFTLVIAPTAEKQGGNSRHVTESKVANTAELPVQQRGENRQQERGENCRQERGENSQQETITNIERICVRDAPHTFDFDQFFQKFRNAYPRIHDLEETRIELFKAIDAGADPLSILEGVFGYVDENQSNIAKGNLEYLMFSENWVRKSGWTNHTATSETRADDSASVAKVDERWIKAITTGHQSLARHCSVKKALDLVAQELVTKDQCRAVGISL